jgi:hypothetical protein
MVGMPAAGSTLGNGLGAALSKWVGAGDYAVSKNSIVARASNSVPAMHSNDQSIVVRHKEYIGPINSSVAFQVQYQLTLNPGLYATFPWLANLAVAYQQWAPRGMVFHYVPSSGYAVSGSNPAIGNVMIQTSYRSGDTPPASKIHMLNEYWASEGLPSETLAHPIECDPKENPFAVHYCRSGNIPSGEPLMYDLGTTFVATQGMPADGNLVGDLWVTYEIEFKKPQITSSVTSVAQYYAARFAEPTSSSFFDGVKSQVYGSLNVSFTVREITLPIGMAGRFVIHCVMVPTTTFITSSGAVWSGSPGLVGCAEDPTLLAGLSPWTTTLGAGDASLAVYYSVSVVKLDPSIIATVTLPQTLTTGGASYIAVTVGNLGLS